MIDARLTVWDFSPGAAPGHTELWISYHHGKVDLCSTVRTLGRGEVRRDQTLPANDEGVANLIEKFVKQFPHTVLKGYVNIKWSTDSRGGGRLEVSSLQELMEFVELGLSLCQEKYTVPKRARMVH